MDSHEFKKIAKELGADLAGIASVQRFDHAPKGFKPTEIFPGTKSVIAYAKRFPHSVFSAESPVPYTFASSVTLQRSSGLPMDWSFGWRNMERRLFPSRANLMSTGMRRSERAGALDGVTVNQKKCREGSQSVTKKGYFLYICHLCRQTCPSSTGIKKKLTLIKKLIKLGVAEYYSGIFSPSPS